MAETNQIVYEIITRGGSKLSSEIHAIENNLERMGHILAHTFEVFGQKANYSVRYLKELKEQLRYLGKIGSTDFFDRTTSSKTRAEATGFTSYFSGPMTRKNEQANIDLAKKLHSIRNQSRSELAQTLLKKTFPSQLLLPYDIGAGFLMGSDTTPLTRSMQSWHDIAETVRAKNRQQDASRKELARKLLAKAFPSQLLLPYNPNAELLPRNQIEKDGLANRIGLQRLARERLRRKLGMDWESRGVANANPANPNSPNYNAPPSPSRWDRWSDNAYERIKTLVPKGAARDIIGRIQGMGAFGKTVGLFVAGILAAGAALAILRRIVTSLFAPLSAMADEVFKFYRTRHQMGGLNNGELSKMGWAGYIMGGKPEENYALMARIAGERASLLWGGNGGRYMSVARRFGVDISGSGAGGLATEREWLRAIAIRMQELDSSGRLALANEAGLSREQMWLVSNGLRYYDWASSRRTLGQMAWGGMLGEDVYTDNFQKESQNFWTDFGAFMMVFKEFWGSVSEILLPVVNLILELLTGIFGLLNLVLKPIATLIGKIFSLLNISFWTNMANMESSIPNYGKYDMGMMQTTMYQHPNANINVGDINVTSNRADPEEVAKEVGNAVAHATLTRVYDVEVGGEDRRIA